MNSSLPTSSAAKRYWQAAAIVYLLAGVAAMYFFSPRVPYADQWNHYTHLLQRPFWIGVFSADNGHAEVLPNLLRLLELHLGTHELLQIAVGMLFAALSVCILLDLVLRDRDLTPTTRAASAFTIVFGIYWLGNTRALTQEHDAVHVYTVILCLSLALRLGVRDAKSSGLPWSRLFGAIFLCLCASLSFGSGVASFVALAMLLILQRVRTAQMLVVLAAALGTILLYRLLPGAVADRSSYALDFPAIILILRLLGSPFVYFFWPLIDPAAAAAAPAPLRDMFVPIANGWTTRFGDIHLSTFPQAAFGLLAVCLLIRTTLRIRDAAASHSARIGVALAWFGVGVAGLIALTRTSYFELHPDQIYAPRYLPWLSLGWTGLILAGVARRHGSRAMLVVALSLPLLALPSEVWMGLLGRRMRMVAEDIALASAVGVFPQSYALGETDVADLEQVLPLLRQARTAMFAWPETQALDQVVPATATVRFATQVTVNPTQNRLSGDAGSDISARFDDACAAPRAMIVAQGKVVGLLRPQADGQWRGVAQGQPVAQALQFYFACD
jgi:hypothetical protein